LSTLNVSSLKENYIPRYLPAGKAQFLSIAEEEVTHPIFRGKVGLEKPTLLRRRSDDMKA